MLATTIYAKLVNMRNAGGALLYKRIKLCDQLLDDRGWVEAVDGGGGDEDKAITRLEDDCFGDCPMSLLELLEVYRAVPDLSTWKKCKYKVTAMLEDVRTKKQPKLRKETLQRGGSTVEVLRDPDTGEWRDGVTEIQRLKAELTEVKGQLRQALAENGKLRRLIQQMRKTANKMQEVL